MMHTYTRIHGVRIQPLVDETTAHASGAQIGRHHGAAVVDQIFHDHDHSQVMSTLAADAPRIRSYFGELTYSYAVPFITAVAQGFAEAVGDRIAACAVRLLLDMSPAELAREIAAARQGADAGFAAAIEELAELEGRGHESPAEPRTGGARTVGPPNPSESVENS